MPPPKRPPPNTKGTKQRQPKTKGKIKQADAKQAVVDQQAFTLRRDGASFQEIADYQKCSISTAYNRVVRKLNEIRRHSQETLEQIKAMDDAALQRAKLEIMRIITGNTEVREKIRAVQALARICERRAKMHGLDAPVRIEEQIDASFSSTIEIDYASLSDADLAAVAELLDRASIGSTTGAGGTGPKIVEALRPPGVEGDPPVN